jgi:hypothetical protein
MLMMFNTYKIIVFFAIFFCSMTRPPLYAPLYSLYHILFYLSSLFCFRFQTRFGLVSVSLTDILIIPYLVLFVKCFFEIFSNFFVSVFRTRFGAVSVSLSSWQVYNTILLGKLQDGMLHKVWGHFLCKVHKSVNSARLRVNEPIIRQNIKKFGEFLVNSPNFA